MIWPTYNELSKFIEEYARRKIGPEIDLTYAEPGSQPKATGAAINFAVAVLEFADHLPAPPQPTRTFAVNKLDEMRQLAEHLESNRLNDPHIGPDDCDLIVAALSTLSSPAPQAVPVTIERVQQRGPNDCGIAALATACAVPYETVLPLLASGSGNGVNEPDLYEWLTANGWAWQMVYMNRREAGRYHKRDPWPPKPFAPVHIVQVRATQDWHFTVMDGSGAVFDPWTAARKSLDHPDYRDVSWVMGLWKVSSPVTRPQSGGDK